MTGELQGRRIVVTGASSGIGEAIARAASAAGARVAVLARTEDKLREGMGERAEEAGLDPRDVAATVIHALAAPPEVVHVELAMVSNRQ
jgi:NADP-dependent 3-hydroxy acid dehydrogenase YdfG